MAAAIPFESFFAEKLAALLSQEFYSGEALAAKRLVLETIICLLLVMENRKKPRDSSPETSGRIKLSARRAPVAGGSLPQTAVVARSPGVSS